MPWAPKGACPTCRRVGCTAHPRREWQRQRERRPMTNREIVRRRQTVQEWREAHGDWCPQCGRYGVELTADHVVPVGAGGSEDGPLRVLCRSCNSSRGARV